MANPVSPANGQFIDKVFWDNEVYNRWRTHYAAWTPYVPDWWAGGVKQTMGNGVLRAWHKRIGTLALFQIQFIWGSSGMPASPTGQWKFTLPPLTRVGEVVGFAQAQARPCIAVQSGADVFLRMHGGSDVTNTVPGTWLAGADLVVMGFFETPAAP